MKEQKFTPGPWRWELNERYRKVVLCGGSPKYDNDVMRFERYGMQGAQPTFFEIEDRGLQGMKASSCGVVVKGREHHSDWFKGVDHPDANLIAAAPELYEALKVFADCAEHIDPEEDGEEWAKFRLLVENFRNAKKAIDKALGNSSKNKSTLIS